MNQILADDVVPVVLAALVPYVVQPAVVRHTRAVVDRFQLRYDAATVCRNVSDDVENWQHGLVRVGLARKRRWIGGTRNCKEGNTHKSCEHRHRRLRGEERKERGGDWLNGVCACSV